MKSASEWSGRVVPEATNLDTCAFTWDELYELLSGAVDRFQYYSDRYGYDEKHAKQHAVLATLEELELERPLCGFALD